MVNIKVRWLRIVLLGVTVFATFSIFQIFELVFAEDPSPRVTVEIAFFSGRHNPEWFYDDPNDIKELQEFLKDLPETTPVKEVPKGFLLHTDDEVRCHFPAWVWLFNGIIKVTTADRTTRFFQDTKGFEAFLRNEAIERGLGEYLE